MKTYKYKPCARCGRNVVHADTDETLCFACLISPRFETCLKYLLADPEYKEKDQIAQKEEGNDAL